MKNIMKEQKFINAIKFFIKNKGHEINSTMSEISEEPSHDENDQPQELSVKVLIKLFKKAEREQSEPVIKPLKMKRLDSLDKV